VYEEGRPNTQLPRVYKNGAKKWRQNAQNGARWSRRNNAASVAKTKILSNIWALFDIKEGPVVTEYLSY